MTTLPVEGVYTAPRFAILVRDCLALKAAEKQRLYHRFAFGGHLLRPNPVGCLMPGSSGSKNGPSARFRQQSGVDAGY